LPPLRDRLSCGSASLASQDLKIGIISAPLPLRHGEFTENSSDLEELREDYKNELIMLHASLKKLDRDLDFSAILNPLLAETGPAMAHVPRLAKQIARMKRYIDEEKAKAQRPAQTSGGSACSAPAQTSRGSGCSAVPAPAQTSGGSAAAEISKPKAK
jgi:hypothetical protein